MPVTIPVVATSSGTILAASCGNILATSCGNILATSCGETTRGEMVWGRNDSDPRRATRYVDPTIVAANYER